MATFNSTGEFCVGDTTIQTTFRVKVNDYEVELPEIHAFGPTGFQDIRLAYIINWVERGIIVEFENIKEEEKATFFIIEYNKYAKQVNDEEGKVVYRLALVAQNWLIRDLHWEERIQGAKQSATSYAVKDKPKINPNFFITITSFGSVLFYYSKYLYVALLHFRVLKNPD